MVRYPGPLRALLLLFAAAFFSGCSEEQAIPDIDLPPTPVLSIKSNWGVINSSHLRLREKPTTDARAITTLWRGYVLEIVSQSAEKEMVEDEVDYWYRINYDGLQGWVFGSYLDLYDSREKAELAAREMQ